MLTDELRAQGWKPHDGGPCPVDELASVWVMMGTNPNPVFVRMARWLTDWRHLPDEPEMNIIAYRPEAT